MSRCGDAHLTSAHQFWICRFALGDGPVGERKPVIECRKDHIKLAVLNNHRQRHQDNIGFARGGHHRTRFKHGGGYSRRKRNLGPVAAPRSPIRLADLDPPVQTSHRRG